MAYVRRTLVLDYIIAVMMGYAYVQNGILSYLESYLGSVCLLRFRLAKIKWKPIFLTLLGFLWGGDIIICVFKPPNSSYRNKQYLTIISVKCHNNPSRIYKVSNNIFIWLWNPVSFASAQQCITHYSPSNRGVSNPHIILKKCNYYFISSLLFAKFVSEN